MVAGATMDGKANSDQGNDTILQKQVLTMEKLDGFNRPSTLQHDPAADATAAARTNRAKHKNKPKPVFQPCGPTKRKDPSAPTHPSSSSLHLANTNSTTKKRLPPPSLLSASSLPSPTTPLPKNERPKTNLIAPPNLLSTHSHTLNNNERLPEPNPNVLSKGQPGYETPLSFATPPRVKIRDQQQQSHNRPRVSLTQSPRQEQYNANNKPETNTNNNAKKPKPDPTLIASTTLRQKSLAVTRQSTSLSDPPSPVPNSSAAIGGKPFDSSSDRLQKVSRALNHSNNQVINVDETPSPSPPSANISHKKSIPIAIPPPPPLPSSTGRHPSLGDSLPPLPSIPRKDPTKDIPEGGEREYDTMPQPARHIINSRKDQPRPRGHDRGYDNRVHRSYGACGGRYGGRHNSHEEGISLAGVEPHISSTPRKYLDHNIPRNNGDNDVRLAKRPRSGNMQRDQYFSPSAGTFHKEVEGSNHRARMAFAPESRASSFSSSALRPESSYRSYPKILSQQQLPENTSTQRINHSNRSIAERRHGTPGNNAQREAHQRESISLLDDDHSHKPQEELRLPPNPQPFANMSNCSISDATRAATEAVGLNPEPLHDVETTNAVAGTNSSGMEIVISVENNMHVPSTMMDANMSGIPEPATNSVVEKAAAEAAARAAEMASASVLGVAVDVDADADADGNEKKANIVQNVDMQDNVSTDSGAEQTCLEEEIIEEWKTIKSDPTTNAMLMDEALEEHPRLLSFPFLGLKETDVYHLFEANLGKLREIEPTSCSDDEMDVDVDTDSVSVVEIENDGGKSENVVVNVDDVDDEKKINNSTTSNDSSIGLSDSLGRWIDLNNNQIRSVDVQLCNLLRKLHVSRLNLAHNELQVIPSELGFCSRLRMLDLSHNDISGCLPESITQLENLGVLDVSHNRIERFPPNFHRLKNLEAVLASHNALSKIPEDFIEKGSKIIGLDISYNRNLRTIPSCLKIISHNNGQLEYKNTRLYKIAPPKDQNGRPNGLRNLAGKTWDELRYKQMNGRFPPPPSLVNDVKQIDPNARRTRGQRTNCTI